MGLGLEAAKFIGLGIADNLAIPAGLFFGARKFYKAANRADRKRAKMNELYSYKGSQRSIGTKRGRSMSRRSSRSRSASRSGRHGNPGGVGHYTGKLRPPKKPRGPSKYDKWGFSGEAERFGNQDMSGEVCYIGATSICHKDLGPAVGIAFIRKIMKRHYQYEYTDIRQAVAPRSNVCGIGPYAIEFYYEEITQIDAEPTYGGGYTLFLDPLNGGAATTLQLAGTLFYNNVLIHDNFGASQPSGNFPYRRFHGYRFVETDYTVQGADPVGGNLDRYSTLYPVKNQYLTVYHRVTFGIQNVTPADDGSLLTTHVDSNPVKGKLFKFKDLLPRLQQNRGAFGTLTSDNAKDLMIDPNGDGVIKPDQALGDCWVQVPKASMFSNCIGELSVKLEPGEIKDYSFVFKFNGTLEKFMNGIAVSPTGLPYPLQKGAFGTSILFALEKRMPTGVANPSINFHYESSFGAVFGKRLGSLLQRGAAGQSEVADQDNV